MCSDPSLEGDKWTQTMLGKSPPQHNRATRTSHCRGQAFSPVLFSWCMPHMHSPTCREYGER
uniref:Uncharacterized protein n=1 Tax=Anguilla anguilla TaxID=7936 RepID=A0A0E9XXD8_ANGAN